MDRYELIYRSTKGSPLTPDEIDSNFRKIKTGHDIVLNEIINLNTAKEAQKNQIAGIAVQISGFEGRLLSQSEKLDTLLSGGIDVSNIEVDLSNYYTKTEVDSLIPTIPSLTGYATESYVTSQIANIQTGGEVDLSGYATTAQLNSAISAISTFSGNYNDLTNKPTIPSLTGYATESYVTSQIANIQTGGEVDLSGYVTSLQLASALANTFDGDYNSLTNKPTIPSLTGYATTTFVTNAVSNVDTFSGNYNDLTNKPVIPSVDGLASIAYVDLQVAQAVAGGQIDLSGYATTVELNNAISGINTFSGDYNDLTNKPVIPSAPDLSGYALKTELFSGNYADLSGLPTIPSTANFLTATQIDARISDATFDPTGYATEAYVAQAIIDASGGQVDLSGYATTVELNNAIAGVNTFSGSYADLTDKPTLFSGAYADLTGKPTIPTVPTKLSEFTNDVPFATVDQVISVGQQYVAADDLITANYQAADTAITTAYLEADAATLVTANQYTDNAVISAVSSLVDSSPTTLNTLNELAAALGDDPNFATTVTNSIATKLPLSGGTLTGALVLNGAPANANEAATKAYVDNAISSNGSPTLLSELTNDTNFISKDTSGPQNWVDLGANTALYWGTSNTNITGNSGIIDMKPNGTGVASFETTGLVIDLLKDIRYQKNNGVYTTLDFAGTVNSDNHTIVIPDASGTMALTSDIPTDINQLNDVNNLLSGASSSQTAGVVNITGVAPTDPLDVNETGSTTSSDGLNLLKFTGGMPISESEIPGILNSEALSASWDPVTGSLYNAKFGINTIRSNASDILRHMVGMSWAGHGDTTIIGNINKTLDAVQLIAGMGINGPNVNIQTIDNGQFTAQAHLINLSTREQDNFTTGSRISISTNEIILDGPLTFQNNDDAPLVASTQDTIYAHQNGLHNTNRELNKAHFAMFWGMTSSQIVSRVIQPDYTNPQESFMVNKLLEFSTAKGHRWIDIDPNYGAVDRPIRDIYIDRNGDGKVVLAGWRTHGIEPGTAIVVHNAGSSVELTGNTYYAGGYTSGSTTSNVTLYTDAALTTLLDPATVTAFSNPTGWEYFNVPTGTSPITPSDGLEMIKLAMDFKSGQTVWTDGVSLASEYTWGLWNAFETVIKSEWNEYKNALFTYEYQSVTYTDLSIWDNTQHLGDHTGSGDVNIGNGDNGLIIQTKVPTSSIGAEYDVAGMVAFDDAYIYRCVANYDGTTDIWKRVALTGGSW